MIRLFANRKFKVLSILTCIVALMAIFMFAYVSFAGNVKNSAAKSSAVINDDPTKKIQMTFNISGSGDLVFQVEDPDTGKEVDWPTDKPFVFNDLAPEYKSVDKVTVRHESLKPDPYYWFDLFEKGELIGSVHTYIYGGFGSGVTSISLVGDTEYTKSFTTNVTINGGLKGTAKLKASIIDSATGTETPVPNSNILLLDSNGKKLRDVTTNKDGEYTITDLTKEEIVNSTFFLVGKDTCSDDLYVCDISDWKNSYNEVHLNTEENCAILLDTSENIENFKLKAEVNDPDHPEKFELVVPRLHVPGFFNSNDIDPKVKLTISETGSCLLGIYVESFLFESIEIEPLYATGFVFDYWTINGKNYTAGQPVEEWDMKSQLKANPFAKVAGDDPTPTPTPDPTPTPVTPGSDVISGNKTSIAAKTGDALPLGIVFALIGIAGTSAFVARKRSKK